MSGILNYALVGLKRLLKNKCFSTNKGINELKQQWIRRSDSFAAFCMDKIEYCYERKISKDELKRAYSEYCRNHEVKPQNERSIRKTLLDDFSCWDERLHVENKGQIWFWNGIKFKDSSINPIKAINLVSTPTEEKSFLSGSKRGDCLDCLDSYIKGVPKTSLFDKKSVTTHNERIIFY